VEGLNIFRDQLSTSRRLIAKTNYTFNGVDPKLVDFFKLGNNGATVGVPFAVYPSFIYYNKDLFKEAGCRTRRPRSVTCTGQAVGPRPLRSWP
jgi:multiple sugar transport system substrate-binding protein